MQPKLFFAVFISAIYLVILIGMSASAVFLAVLVLNVHHHDPSKPVPKWVENLVFVGLATLVCKRKAVSELGLWGNKAKVHPAVEMKDGNTSFAIITKEIEVTKEEVRKNDGESNSPNPVSVDAGTGESSVTPSAGNYGNCWILAAQILDRFFMWSYLIVLVVTTLLLMVILPRTAAT